MNYKEYGTQNQDVIILLHGGGLSWWNYREEAERLQGEYHVILPILDGHADSGRDFTTIEANAAALISLIDERFGGRVLLIGGLSLGAQVLLEMLAQRGNICTFAVVESALVVPSRLTHALIKPAFGSSYGLIRRRWFARLQFRSLRIQPPLFEDYYRDTCAVTKENMIAFLKENSVYTLKASLGHCSARVLVLVGAKEYPSMKTSARLIHEGIEGSTLQTLPKLHHGEFSLNHGKEYVEVLYSWMKGNE